MEAVARGGAGLSMQSLVAARSLMVFAGLWALATFLVGNAVLLPSPIATAAALISLARTGELFGNIAVSLARLTVSLALALLLAVPLGILLGLSARARTLLGPALELIRPISGIAWIPIGLFIFGIGNALPVFIMVIAAFFPLLFNTAAGVESVDPALVAAGRTLGLPRRRIVRRVLLPAALPSILVGFRLAVRLSTESAVAA